MAQNLALKPALDFSLAHHPTKPHHNSASSSSKAEMTLTDKLVQLVVGHGSSMGTIRSNLITNEARGTASARNHERRRIERDFERRGIKPRQYHEGDQQPEAVATSDTEGVVKSEPERVASRPERGQS